MLRLKKAKVTQWQGNGFGTNPAEWVLKDYPYIGIRKLSTGWWAIYLDTNAKICRRNTRADLLEALPEFINAE